MARNRNKQFGSFNSRFAKQQRSGNFTRPVRNTIREPRDISRFARGNRATFGRKYVDACGYDNNFDYGAKYNETPATFGRSLQNEVDRPMMVDTTEYETERSFDDRSFGSPSDQDCIEDMACCLEDFIDNYMTEEVQRSFTNQKDLIAEMLIPVSQILFHYYDPRYSELTDQMNSVLKIMSTVIFTQSLRAVLRERVGEEDDPEGYFDNWETDYQYVGFAVSLVLGTRRASMLDETEEIYIDTIGPGIWSTEVTDMMNTIHVTKELATDLMLKTPIIYDKMETHHIQLFYRGFLDSIILHADDNVEMLDATLQSKLFNYLYGKGKTAAKVIGKCLTDMPRETFRSEAEKAVYGEYRKMLYTKLNSFDIDRIRYVLRYVSKCKAKEPDAPMVFDTDTAMEESNIAKAMKGLVEEDKDIVL